MKRKSKNYSCQNEIFPIFFIHLQDSIFCPFTHCFCLDVFPRVSISPTAVFLPIFLNKAKLQIQKTALITSLQKKLLEKCWWNWHRLSDISFHWFVVIRKALFSELLWEWKMKIVWTPSSNSIFLLFGPRKKQFFESSFPLLVS